MCLSSRRSFSVWRFVFFFFLCGSCLFSPFNLIGVDLSAIQSPFHSFPLILILIITHRYHTLSNHSKSIAAFGNQLDYLGVVILMWGSTVPSVYYGFYCDEKIRDM